MSKILFIVNDGWQKEINIGDLFILMNVAYWKGMELGYPEENVYFEWPIRIRYFTGNEKVREVPCPPDNFIPINLIERGAIHYDEFDKIINFNMPDSLYEGYKPIYTNREYPLGGRHYTSFYGYLNMYFMITGTRPELSIPKDGDKKYILFHFRNVNLSNIDGHGQTFRNVNPRTLLELFNIVKDEFGDEYEMWKCGEQIRALDRKFDYVAPYYVDNLNDFLRLVNNSSILIGADSSPMSAAEILGIPRIRYDTQRVTKHGDPTWFTAEWWKAHDGIGNDMFMWQDPEKQITFWNDKEIDKDVFLGFMKKCL